MPDKPIPQINIETVLQSTLDPVAKTHRHHLQPAAEPGSVQGPLVASSDAGSGSGHGRMKRIARKPLRLAGSAIRYGLRRGESSQSSAGQGAVGEPEAVVVARGRRKPLDGEKEVAVLRVRVVACEGLVVKDRSGSSDPFVSVSLPPTQAVQTPVIKRSLNPNFPAAQSTFDFPLYASLAASGLYQGRGLEIVVWDKDLMKKDYMGEVAVPLPQWFPAGSSAVWDSKADQGRPFDLVSARRRRRVSGKVYLRYGIVLPEGGDEEDREGRARQVLRMLETKADGHMATLMDVPAYQGIGTVKIKRRHPRSSRRKDKGSETPTATTTSKFASAARGLLSRTKKGRRRHEEKAIPAGSAPGAMAPAVDSGMFAADNAGSDGSDTVSADDDDEDEDDADEESEELRDDGLSSDSDFPNDDAFFSEEDDILSGDSAEGESTYPTQGEDVNDRVGPLATGNNSSATSSSLRVAGGAVGGRRPKRQTSVNSTSSNDASGYAPLVAGLQQSRQGQDASAAASNTGSTVSPSVSPPPETSVRIVSPATQAQEQGYFDTVPPPAAPSTSATTSRRRLFKKSSRDHHLAPGPSASGFRTPGEESTSASTPGTATPGSLAPGVPATQGRQRRPVFKRGKGRAGTTYTLGHQAGHDILGIVMLEIGGAADLPKLRNSFRFSFDMDPFVVISFGKKVFRTRVIRHSLNPTWDEKMLFHVRQYEDTFSIQFAVLDWDKVSGNDFIGSSTIPLAALVADAPKPDAKTGLYGPKEDGKHEMKAFNLPITTPKDAAWETKYSPVLKVRAKYEPYDALRQRFWRQYLTQYDTDDTGAISYTELTTMLDSLGSTLSSSTLHGYFERFHKSYEEGELTFDQIIQCLEDEVRKQRKEKRRLSESTPLSGVATPVGYGMAPRPARDGLDYAGQSAAPPPSVDADELARHIRASAPRADADSEGNGDINVKPLPKVDHVKGKLGAEQHLAVGAALSPDMSPAESEIDDGLQDSSTPDDMERVVNIKTCPLCHRPRLNKKSEADIITHLAVCASADWSRVDRIVVGNYVTASQAQRKFLSKVLTKLSSGAYSLGANSANIIVQDRATGQLQEEKMAVYVRLGIRVLYKGAKGRMEGGRARRLMKSMSVKQGIKYDSPESKLEIPTFIAFHNLNVDEILDPIDSFQTFNQFFYRKLRPDARPISDPEDPGRLVSCADCRMMAFESVSEATRIWVKGREFSVGRLLGPKYKDVIHKFEGGALGIFRLAPQDYHRFHSPVEGVIGKSTFIDGQYYTVNPQAIRTTLDVYGENVRKIVPIESPHFGTVMTVWVGAMMVGSIGTTVKEGDHVKRGDELGWFAFGGSTIVCIFEQGALQWDDDLLQNGQQSIETLVRMGSGLGHATGQAISFTGSSDVNMNRVS
ncbi:hypothetical protein QFC21_000020 [Naganishia friedmannii]|uniref:Uncharacterized protein n=1 Tax=Naganishia friedmannii TaxID=89922 RepID=A0ACC2WAA2_9TREE|nr:hypothetical protein QFC21_000020 [Naganishia friedmannii]